MTWSTEKPDPIELPPTGIGAGTVPEAALAELAQHIDRVSQGLLDRIPEAPADATILALLQIAAQYGLHGQWELDGFMRAARAAWRDTERRHQR